MIPHNSVSTWTWAMCNLPSNMKSSSHKTLKTSLLFWKPLQVQNLKRKSVGTWHIIYPLCPPPNCAHRHCHWTVSATYAFSGIEKSYFYQIYIQFFDEKPPGRRLWSMAEKGQSAWGRLSRHVDTTDLNQPRTHFTHFLFQHSYLSNPVKEIKFPTTHSFLLFEPSLWSALWVG